MSSCVINVKKRMKEEAHLKLSKRICKDFNISAEAVQEEISFLNAIIETHMVKAMEIAHNENMKTVMSEHIVQANGVRY